ncbi:MAG TPA: sporulation YhaL family protein [Bacteroidales bacterium]|nr:sporulation YhaL family protein [Bacteroidales bacterium]
MDLPLWIYVVMFGIIFSAFMVIKTAKDEQEIEEKFIEKEGEAFLEQVRKESQQKIQHSVEQDRR